MNLINYFRKISTLNFLPRWLVLILDVVFVFSSIVLIHIVLSGIKKHLYFPYVIKASMLYIAINVYFFWKFKVYSGIIRHSTFVDLRKIFLSQFTTTAIIVAINYFCYFVFNVKLMLTTELLFIFIFSFFFLVGYRLIVKSMFFLIKKKLFANEKKGVVVYGIDEHSITMALALKNDPNSIYEVKGFINPKDDKPNLFILNLPVFSSKYKGYVVARKLGAKAILYTSNADSVSNKIEYVNQCLDYNIEVLFMPEISKSNKKTDVSSKIRNIKIQDLLERKEIYIKNKDIESDLEGKVVLVSGAAGSIGSEIAFQVLEYHPKKLILLDQAETPLHNISLELEKIKGNTEIIYAIADIRRKDEIEFIFKKYQPVQIYHAAAYKHVPLMEKNPIQAVTTNVFGTRNLADLAVQYGVKKFVMVSTDKAVNPSNIMGASKRIAEKYVQSLSKKIQHTTQFVTTRFGNVLGSNGSVVPLFTKQIEQGGPITITHPDIIRYFMTIPEACQLVLEAGTMGKGGEIFIFDMGKPVKIVDLAKKMIQLSGLTLDKDIKIEFVGLRPGEKLYEELLYDTATTLPTHNDKIMISKDENENYEKVSEQLGKLRIFAEQNNVIELVKIMKNITPEFVSLNSEFSLLDKK